MATSANLVAFDGVQAFAITLASLAAGAARQATMVDNSVLKRPAALVQAKITTGASAPAASEVYSVWLVRKPGTLSVDGVGAVDAAATPLNMVQLGTIRVTAAVNTAFVSDPFDTLPFGPLGPSWTVVLKNETGFTINATEANHRIEYSTYYPEAQ